MTRRGKPKTNQPPKINEALLKNYEYFGKSLTFSDDQVKFICHSCKKALTAGFEGSLTPAKEAALAEKYMFNKAWLPQHLDTIQHRNYEEDRPGLHAALLLFNKEGLEEFKIEEKTSKPPVTRSGEERTNQESGKGESVEDEAELGKHKEIELIFDTCKFMIEKHLPFDAAEDVFEFNQKISSKYHPDLIKRTSASSTTISHVIKDCIGSCFKEFLLKDLETCPFSLIIDAASDLYGANYLGVLVRYLEDLTSPPVTKLLSVVELGISSKGEDIYEKIVNEVLLDNWSIINNMVAICTDGGTNLASSQGAGVYNRLQKVVKSLVHVRDLCHAYQNIAEAGSQLFPKYIIDFVKDCCSFIHRSAQRQIRFRDLVINKRSQDPTWKLSSLKQVPSFKEIRWLSLTKCAEFIVEYWEELKDFYASETFGIKDLFTSEYLLYTQLLALILRKINYYTIHFESGQYMMNHVIEHMKLSYNEFVQYILKSPYDRPEKEVNYFDIVFAIKLDELSSPNHIKTITEFKQYFLEKFPGFVPLIAEAVKLNSSLELSFVKTAKDCFITIVRLMRENLLFSNDIIQRSLVAYLPKDLNVENWKFLAKRFSNIIPSYADFENEFDRFRASYANFYIQETPVLPSTIMKKWEIINQDFQLITRLGISLLILPYSSAEVESLFSKFKVVKTPYRNRLTAANLEASLLAEQYFGNDEFNILPEMYSKYLSLWDNKKKKVINSQKKSVETQFSYTQTELSSEKEPVFGEQMKILNELLDEGFDFGIENTEYLPIEPGSLRRLPSQQLGDRGQKLVKFAVSLLSLVKGSKSLNKGEEFDSKDDESQSQIQSQSQTIETESQISLRKK